MVDECSVGISQYANAAPAISGILRHRYSDFKVNEIDTRMRVARLFENDLFPAEIADAPVQRRVHSFDNESAIQACVKSFSDLAGSEHAAALLKLLQELRDRVRAFHSSEAHAL